MSDAPFFLVVRRRKCKSKGGSIQKHLSHSPEMVLLSASIAALQLALAEPPLTCATPAAGVQGASRESRAAVAFLGRFVENDHTDPPLVNGVVVGGGTAQQAEPWHWQRRCPRVLPSEYKKVGDEAPMGIGLQLGECEGHASRVIRDEARSAANKLAVDRLPSFICLDEPPAVGVSAGSKTPLENALSMKDTEACRTLYAVSNRALAAAATVARRWRMAIGSKR
eukprot:CAMPEP_0174743234 /NCGR_PEP_ID=MMETSP1094-20130205/81081_1 /TAXON_ID=156173 /ORGANISM="Chrysochromulina brevifilum, Strain UTEX LB 985" /LENGTH=223 /DNA_ID=CAMNT_0015947419 /DNA_START=98 /DNA_END=767 /DNA_ORIENTATION=+